MQPPCVPIGTSRFAHSAAATRFVHRSFVERLARNTSSHASNPSTRSRPTNGYLFCEIGSATPRYPPRKQGKHGREIGHRRNPREILQQDAGWTERDLLARSAFRIPRCYGSNVLFSYCLPIFMPQQILEENSD